MKKKNHLRPYRILAFSILMGIMISGWACAAEEPYPAKTIQGIIIFGAGGATDTISRTISPLAEKHLGQSIVMTNKTGAAGAIALQYVNRQRADGYTLLFGSEPPGIHKVLKTSLIDYNDFEPILLFGSATHVVIVPSNSPYNSIDELLEAAKKNPGKINVASSGAGGGPFNAFSYFSRTENIKFNFATFKGESACATAVLGNHVDVSVITVPGVAQYVNSGQVKALAVMSNHSIANLPNVPALGQVKPEYKEFLEIWPVPFGVFVKKGTPSEAITKLTGAFKQAAQDPAYLKYLKEGGLQPLGLSGEKATEYLKKWQQYMSWLLWDVGAAIESPEKFGIKRP